jgi:outer membrane receptor for ferrienterochelin and colicins
MPRFLYFVLYTITLFACALATANAKTTAAMADDDSLFYHSLEELFDVKISTVSRTEESLHDTPATVMVITAEMIKAHGYKEFSEIFDDLPGMEVIRPYGDTWISHYWRGESQRGGTVLLLLDGNVMNHLYFDNIFVQSALSLSNIKQVEIVLGPAAVPYGDNAFLGTINVITHADTKRGASEFNGFTAFGSNQRKIIDFHQLFSNGDWRLNFAFRLDKGLVDDSNINAYEYTKNHYYTDPRLWGDFVNNPALAGGFRSPHDNRSFDVRLAYQTTQLSVQHFEINSGYGTAYAADKAQNRGRWIRPDSSADLRHKMRLSPELTSTSQFRYRRSDIDNDSLFLEAFPFPDVPGGRLMDISYWRSINRSVAAYQDFEYQSTNWRSAFGLRYEKKKLQKNYDVTRGDSPFVPPSLLTDWQDYDFPTPPTSSSIDNNRTTISEKSLYLMLNRSIEPLWDWGKKHLLNVGMRYEDNSVFGSRPLFKLGYVVEDGNYSYKWMWGESFQEPSARALYGGWQGLGSDPDLAPEESTTIEISWNYITAKSRLTLALVEIEAEQTITLFAGGASNDPGARKLRSLDMIGQQAFVWQGLRINGWLNYSHVFNVTPITRAESIEQSFELNTANGPTGNTAEDKLMFGATIGFTDHLSTTVANRYISKRHTSALNGVASVPSYFVTDLTLRWQDVLPGGDISIQATNLFDKTYFHPGVNDGNAGVSPGSFDTDGIFSGSSGFLNSLLPQAGRQLTLRLDFRF